MTDLLLECAHLIESQNKRIAELESKLAQEGGYRVVLEASKLVQELHKERIAELEDKIRADHAKKVGVQVFAELRLCVEENPKQPFTKKQLRKSLQHTIDALRQIAMDEVPPQEIGNE